MNLSLYERVWRRAMAARVLGPGESIQLSVGTVRGSGWQGNRKAT